MNLDDYQIFTKTTAFYPGEGIDALPYLALGLNGESGEIAEKVKKYIRDKNWDDDNFIKEIGDVFWYLVRICDEMDIKASDVLKINHTKLISRQARGVLSGNGDNR